MDAILAEYCNDYFGPAAAAMSAFIEFSEANWMNMGQDAGKIGRALELLASAQAAVEPQSAPGRRIAKITQIMQPILNVATTRADDPQLLEGDFVSLLLETPSRSYYEIAINPAGAVRMALSPLRLLC
ncbi:MAG: hypothetical protein ACYC6Y_11660 [Thermoguttaceae bacterium]